MLQWTKSIINKTDKVIYNFLGLEKNNINRVSPKNVSLDHGSIKIKSIEAFSRVHYTYDWCEYLKNDLVYTSQQDKEKLGVAIGKTIAKDLTVSFDKAQMVRK